MRWALTKHNSQLPLQVCRRHLIHFATLQSQKAAVLPKQCMHGILQHHTPQRENLLWIIETRRIPNAFPS